MALQHPAGSLCRHGVTAACTALICAGGRQGAAGTTAGAAGTGASALWHTSTLASLHCRARLGCSGTGSCAGGCRWAGATATSAPGCGCLCGVEGMHTHTQTQTPLASRLCACTALTIHGSLTHRQAPCYLRLPVCPIKPHILKCCPLHM